jgi:NadR type nicotinamide-nucleotide adenylyltransferase
MLKKIVIIGPESTGKSTLSEQLADHYHTNWCPEYAREYLTINETDYTYNDLLEIAKGQIKLEEKYIQLVTDNRQQATVHHSLLFIDTDMYIMKVWCEFVYGKCHQYILEQIAERKYDLYLLCNTDLPWISDKLREYPDMEQRKKLYKIYKDLLTNQPVPWVEISGNYEARLKKAIEAVDSLLK